MAALASVRYRTQSTSIVATRNYLPDRQQQVIEFICQEIIDLHGMPSQSDIAREFAITRQTAAGHVVALERKGWLRRTEGGQALEPTSRAWNKQYQQQQDHLARRSLPRGLNARAVIAVGAALRGLALAEQQMVLEFAR